MTIKAFSHWRLSLEQCFGKFDKKADFQPFFWHSILPNVWKHGANDWKFPEELFFNSFF